MIQKNKTLSQSNNLLIKIVLFFVFLVPMISAIDVFAECAPGTQYLPGKSSGVCIPIPTEVGLTQDEPIEIIVKVVTFLLGFVGALAVLMIIVGGIWYMTSGGDESRIDTAKRILVWAIGGLVVALLGWVIVNSVVNAFNPPTTVPVGGGSSSGNPAYTLPTTIGG